MSEAGYVFDVISSDADEEAIGLGVEPRQLPLVLAEAKTDALLLSKADEIAAAVLVSADTVVYAANGQVLGKPTDPDDARRMISTLAGTLHKVVTGFCIHDARDGRRVGMMIKSDVLMRQLAGDDIEKYVATGQWQGKAGGYGIQDEPGTAFGADPFIERLEGELTNVIGLPMPQVIDVLSDFGIEPERS